MQRIRDGCRFLDYRPRIHEVTGHEVGQRQAVGRFAAAFGVVDLDRDGSCQAETPGAGPQAPVSRLANPWYAIAIDSL